MLVYLISDGITKSLPFLIFPLIAYYLTKESYAIVSNFQVLTGIIAPFVGLSASSYFMVEFYKSNINPVIIFNNIIYLYLLLSVIVFIFVISFISYISVYTKLDVVWIYFAITYVLSNAFTDLLLSRLRIEEKAKKFGIFTIYSSLISVLMTILFVVVLKMEASGRIISLLVSSLFLGVVSLYYSKKYIGKLKPLKLVIWKNLFIFGLPLLPHNLSIWIRNGFDKIYITSAKGLAENGTYSFAITISSIYIMFSGAFFSAFSPYVYKTLSKAESESNDDFLETKRNIVKKAYYFIAIYLVIMFVGYFIVQIIINLFLKEKYSEAITFLPYLIVYNFFNTAYIFVSMILYYSKNTKYLGLITIFSALIQSVLMIFLVNFVGTKGAVISSMLVSSMTFYAVYIYSNNVYPMPWFYMFKKSFIKNKAIIIFNILKNKNQP